MGMKWIEFVFRQRPVSQSELYRNIVKPARREAAIEMPHPRNNHSDDRDVDVGARLIQDKKVEALAFRETHAGGHLLARVVTAEFGADIQLDCWMVAWRQEGMVRQAQW